MDLIWVLTRFVYDVAVKPASLPQGEVDVQYGVYKQTHGENCRWYVKAIPDGETGDSAYVTAVLFDGDTARARACNLARELNDKAGPLALAA